MRLRRLAAMTVTLALWIVLSGFGVFQTRSERCERIPSGASLEAISEILGEPERKYEKNGRVSVQFKPDPLSSGPIIAFVDTKSGRVLALLCRYGGSVSWEVTE